MADNFEGNAVWYTDGVVSVTQDSYTVVGAGTLFTSQVAAGDCFSVLSNGGVMKFYQVQSIEDDAHLTLMEPYYESTAAGVEYAVIRNFSGTWSISTQLASQMATLRRAWATALATQFKGDAAPNMVLQFSADATTWHASYVSGDIYIRFSVDDSVTWSAAARFRGEDGADAPAVQIQYSVNGSTLWHASYVSGDYYARFSTNGGTSWGGAVLFRGPTGAPASELQIQYSADGSSWHSAAASGDTYIRFSTDGGTLWGSAFYVAPLATNSVAGLIKTASSASAKTGAATDEAVTPASLKANVPYKTTGNVSLYVNSGAAYGWWGAGSDSNAGTQAAPFATIAAAIAAVPETLAHNVTITLAGEPHFYEWKPDGTNGIKFTTGDSGVTVAVASGTTLGVAISGSAVTITLATGGSTIAQILAAIQASATVGPVIYAIAVGTTSTNITATLAAQSLSGGNVRTYAETIALYDFVGNNLTIAASGSTTNLGVRLEADYSAGSAITISTRCSVLLYRFAIRTTVVSQHSAVFISSASTAYPSLLHIGGGFGSAVLLRGAISGTSGSNTQIVLCLIYSAAIAALASRGAVMSIEGLYGGGNAVGIRTHGGMVLRVGSILINATTALVTLPAGSIL